MYRALFVVRGADFDAIYGGVVNGRAGRYWRMGGSSTLFAGHYWADCVYIHAPGRNERVDSRTGAEFYTEGQRCQSSKNCMKSSIAIFAMRH